MNHYEFTIVAALISGVGFTSTTVAVARMLEAPIPVAAYLPLVLAVALMAFYPRSETDSAEVSG